MEKLFDVHSFKFLLKRSHGGIEQAGHVQYVGKTGKVLVNKVPAEEILVDRVGDHYVPPLTLMYNF